MLSVCTWRELCVFPCLNSPLLSLPAVQRHKKVSEAILRMADETFFLRGREREGGRESGWDSGRGSTKGGREIIETVKWAENNLGRKGSLQPQPVGAHPFCLTETEVRNGSGMERLQHHNTEHRNKVTIQRWLSCRGCFKRVPNALYSDRINTYE